MHVKLLNGERGVAALIVNDGVSYINLEYERGAMTGDVERMNKYGRNELKGCVVDGVEDGLFMEMMIMRRWYGDGTTGMVKGILRWLRVVSWMGIMM